MSKNFEEEYKALAQQDAPDLWERIEAGLTPRPRNSKGKQILHFFNKYKTIVAAALCVAVILPAAILLKETNNFNNAESQTEMMMTDAAEPAAEESAAEADMAEPAAEESAAEADAAEPAAEESTAGSDAAKDSAAAETESLMLERAVEDAAAETGAAETEANHTAAGGLQKQMAENERQSQAGAESTAGAGQVTAEIQVISTQTISRNEEFGTLYRVQVLKADPAGIFAEDEKIDLYQSVLASTVLMEGEIRQVEITVDEESEYPYVLEKLVK